MLTGKTAVITGGCRGIGRAIAMAMAKSGANVALVDIDPIRYENTANEIALLNQGSEIVARSYVCNVADFEQSKEVCGAIFKDFGKVDILVNNAGITRDGLLMAMKEADFDDVISVNLKGAFNFTRHLSRYIAKSSAGRIINIASVSGISGNIGQANYSAAKAGLIGLTKTTARELAARAVTCNAIAPGFIETDMTAALPKEIIDKVLTAVPLGRMGKSEEVADLTVFLASDSAAYITGEVIKIDGGMLT